MSYLNIKGSVLNAVVKTVQTQEVIRTVISRRAITNRAEQSQAKDLKSSLSVIRML